MSQNFYLFSLEFMRKWPETSLWLNSKLVGGITAAVALKILLALNSCSTGKFVEKENNLDSNFAYVNTNPADTDSISIAKQMKAEEDAFNFTYDSNLVEWNKKLDMQQQEISVSEWPWKIYIPPQCEAVFHLKAYDPDGNIIFDEMPKWPYKDVTDTIDVPITLTEEGTYKLVVGIWCDDPSPRILATYDYHKPETLTPINIQTGEFMLDQDIQWPVKIIMINLNNNISQEVVLNQNLKQWEILNVFQYLDISKFHWKNCALIIKDWSDQIVFDLKFHKI